MLARIDIQIVAVDEALAHEAIVCWRRFGKGRHRAALNYGNTFSYALAHKMGLTLLFVGDDFSYTDIIAG